MSNILGNRYQLLRKVGDGGMAFVYEAKDKSLNRIVAVKVLRPEFGDDEDFLKKFRREAEAIASVSHPNIVSIYDVGEDRNVNYIVMEFIDGKNLKDIIRSEGILDEYTALEITKQIAKALSLAHRKGIIHRDIKPHNILISNEGRIVKVADFGIAKAVSNSTMTNVGNIIGSVHYFSPEQAKGRSVTSNTDLYSLGIVLFEMLTGRLPFRGDSPISIALQHINDDIEFTDEEKTRIPQSVRTIIRKLTEKSVENRYQNADEVIDDIEYIEKNIDLDFIKEYDSYATKKIDDFETRTYENDYEEDEEYDDEYDEDYEEDDEDVKVKKKARDYSDKDLKSRKKLITIAVILSVIIVGQIVFFKTVLSSSKNMSLQDKMPNLYDMTLEEAQKEIEKLNVKIEVNLREEFNSEVKNGNIASQSPVEGSLIEEGDVINIVLSKGPKGIDVPHIIGETLSSAEEILEDNGFELGNIKYEYDDKYEKGIVISQSPKVGDEGIEKGDSVDVIVSKGQDNGDDEEDRPKENYNSNKNNYNNSSSNSNSGSSSSSGSNGGSTSNGGSSSSSGSNGGSTSNGGSSSNTGSNGGSTSNGGSSSSSGSNGGSTSNGGSSSNTGSNGGSTSNGGSSSSSGSNEGSTSNGGSDSNSGNNGETTPDNGNNSNPGNNEGSTDNGGTTTNPEQPQE